MSEETSSTSSTDFKDDLLEHLEMRRAMSDAKRGNGTSACLTVMVVAFHFLCLFVIIGILAYQCLG